ncbi:MAG: diphosphomevalonate decarboxylase [Flavobacterium sp.]|nr:diphosphomevalonate decarboxylase [Flavobacterium sp.]
MSPSDFIPKPHDTEFSGGKFTSSAPSNIALIKYWGKKANQIPANPSLSFTLQSCKTITTLEFNTKENDGEFSVDLFLDQQRKDDFKPKVLQFFARVEKYLPFLKEYHFTINTHNTFPHSSGIASSASGMAALAVNLMEIERVLNPQMTDEYFYKKASFLARLGSGSACRSVKGRIVSWGEHNEIQGSSDLFGVTLKDNVHADFENYQDTILLVDKGEKTVSSTAGHDLMHNHPFADNRFAQAHVNLSNLRNALIDGDLTKFIEIVESEALTLHAMMLTSVPYFILMKPNTLEIINKIWEYRKNTGIPICFTLDAGANVHVLYPDKHKSEIIEFIKAELVGYCQNGQYLCDSVGNGAERNVQELPAA